MRLHALVFALVVLYARAASIPERADIDFEKTLTEAVKEVLSKDEVALENISSDPELIDQANSVKDIENNLRKRVPVADIPVKVVVDDVKPTQKTSVDKDDKEKENNEVIPESSEEIKRVEIDLKDTGLPQRQQHDTQGPEEIKPEIEAIASLKSIIHDGTEKLQEGVQNQVVQMQHNLQQLEDSFQNQVENFNKTLQKLLSPASGNPAGQAKANVVESSLETLQNNIKAGIKSLADRIETFRAEKQPNKREECSSSPSVPSTEETPNPFQIYFQQIATQMQQGFQNMTTSFQSYVNQTQNNVTSSSTDPNNPAAQSDENATPRPSFWENIQNIFQGGSPQQPQSDTPVSQPATPNRPIVQAIQNNPFVQGVVSVFQPNRPAANQPAAAQATPPKPETAQPNQEGSNSVPTETKPEPEQQKQKPETTTFAQSGPIKQIFIDKNPIVQGIAGAVHRIQDSIKPERPRDAMSGDDEEVPVATGHGHGGSGAGSAATGKLPFLN